MWKIRIVKKSNQMEFGFNHLCDLQEFMATAAETADKPVEFIVYEVEDER